MAIDSASKRASCIGIALLALRTGVIPDASDLGTESQRAHVCGLYSDIDAVDPYIPYSVPYHRRSLKAMAPIKNAGHAMGTLSSAVPLTTIPGNALRARVVGVSGSATVYFREDGGTPSASNGTPIGAGGYADIVGRNNLEGFMAIEASPSGTLWVEYFDSVE